MANNYQMDDVKHPAHINKQNKQKGRSHTSPGVQRGLFGEDDVDLAVCRGWGPKIPIHPLPEVGDCAVAPSQENVRVKLGP